MNYTCSRVPRPLPPREMVGGGWVRGHVRTCSHSAVPPSPLPAVYVDGGADEVIALLSPLPDYLHGLLGPQLVLWVPREPTEGRKLQDVGAGTGRAGGLVVAGIGHAVEEVHLGGG